MSAYWKIPLQIIVLLVGVLVFVFYTFNKGPLTFSEDAQKQVTSGAQAQAYGAVQTEYDAAFEARRQAALDFAAARQSGDATRLDTARSALHEKEAAFQKTRTNARELVRTEKNDKSFTDVNYVIPTFITTWMPIGLMGLLIAAIFAAAMSASAGELNALATATIIDFYRRHFVKESSDAHYLAVSRLATIGWGLFACVVAMYAANQGSLIEVVNRYGSFFYGSLLGVFILAIGSKRATATGALVGLVAGMVVVLTVAFSPWTRDIAFLWHNLIGAVVVVLVGLAISFISPEEQDRTRRQPS